MQERAKKSFWKLKGCIDNKKLLKINRTHQAPRAGWVHVKILGARNKKMQFGRVECCKTTQDLDHQVRNFGTQASKSHPDSFYVAF